MGKTLAGRDTIVICSFRPLHHLSAHRTLDSALDTAHRIARKYQVGWPDEDRLAFANAGDIKSKAIRIFNNVRGRSLLDEILVEELLIEE
jgi:hypothetical protein